MKIIELDLTGCKTLYEIHERIKDAFCFSEDYGHNWDVFWDRLWGECDADQVIIKGEYSLSKEFDKPLSKMHEALEYNIEFRKNNNLAPFSYKIIN